MAPIDEMPRKPGMRVTGLKGTKAKTIKVYNPSLLVVWAFEEVRNIEDFRTCAEISWSYDSEIVKGEPAITLKWSFSVESVRSRIASLQEAIQRTKAKPLAEFLKDIQAQNNRALEGQAARTERWDEEAEKLKYMREAHSRLSRAHLNDKHSLKLLYDLEDAIQERKRYLRENPRIENVKLHPTDQNTLRKWKRDTMGALYRRLHSDQKLLENLTAEGKRAQRRIRKFLRRIVALELQPEPQSQQVAA